MQRKLRKRGCICLIALLPLMVFFLLVMPPSLFVNAAEENAGEENIIEENTEPPIISMERGRVLKKTEETTEYGAIQQYFRVEILTGSYKGQIVMAENTIDAMMVYKIDPNVGDEVILHIEEDGSGSIVQTNIAEFSRQNVLLYLVILFLVILVICGGFKGLKTVITLIFTVAAIVIILLPCMVAGYSPLPITVAICAIVATLTFVIVGGFNLKSLAAILGTTGGVVAAGIIAMLFGYWGKLTGLGESEAQMLTTISQGVDFDFKGLLFASIIIGALGAVMDVAMSIASALNEMKQMRPDLKPYDLMKVGMNVGRDTMGTMSNTLILAYTGSSLPLLMLLMANNVPFTQYINWDSIASEVIRAMAGSIGLVLTIPLTALICSFLLQRTSPVPADHLEQASEFEQEDLYDEEWEGTHDDKTEGNNQLVEGYQLCLGDTNGEEDFPIDADKNAVQRAQGDVLDHKLE